MLTTNKQPVNSLRLKFLLLAAAIGLSPSAVLHADTLTTSSYNFQLAGGGGGASAILNGVQTIEIFCVDYNNDIYVPHTGYNAYLSTLTTGSDLSHTRYGGTNPGQNSLIASEDPADAGTFTTYNSALSRYQMAAYLTAQYNLPGGNSDYNNGIQTAIWQLLDPSSVNTAVNQTNVTNALHEAAQWISDGSVNHDAFLTNYRVVSDTTMKNGVGGFQEQITRVPEPGSLLAFGAALLCLVWRKQRANRRDGLAVTAR